ncbi:MAG: hypothetical protein U9O86_03205 [Campylobacterota bacterium]|nr:hypothetical protein [Campylobacterota bacterium]
MFNNDLLLAFAFMALLFLRQVFILKQPNKINYAPLMIGIGSIASLVHFIIQPDTTNIVLLLRESLFPLLVALLLYIVMNILHQTQISEKTRTQDEFTKVLVSEISDLKKFILDLEERMSSSQEADQLSRQEVRTQFKEDIKALDTVLKNQATFIDKFDEMESWHKSVSKGFEYFTEVQMPELDNVVHKHIDILRVAEQDHYNKLNKLLERAVQSRGDMSEDIDELKENLEKIKGVSNEIANTITKHTLQQLSGVTKAFENQIITLKSHTEGVSTSLYEGDRRLENIRTQSEMIMKQMVLSSNKMQELEKQNSGLHDIYSMLQEIIKDVESVKSDYVKSQSQLSVISQDLAASKDKQVVEMKEKIDDLSDTLSTKIEESLEKLHEHYHIAGEEITQSVQILAKRAQIKSGYGDT